MCGLQLFSRHVLQCAGAADAGGPVSDGATARIPAAGQELALSGGLGKGIGGEMPRALFRVGELAGEVVGDGLEVI